MTDQAGRLWTRLSVEPARPDAVRTSRVSEWLIVATVCIGAFMGQLDASIVTVTLPTLRHVFHASLHDVEWVALAYLVVLVAAVVAVGRFGDVVGRKLLYTYGFAVFTVATVGCGLAPTLGTLIAARVVQALGAAMLQANSVALIITSLPVARRARGLGIQGAAQALGLALGPTVGGLLIAAGGWRWVFFATVPAGVVGTVAGWFLLPRTKDKSAVEPFDARGLLVFAGGAFLLLLALSDATSPAALSLLVPAALLVVVLVRVERSAASPLLPPALFARPGLRASVVAGLLSYWVLFGILVAAPFYCEDALGLSVARSGLVITALPAALGLTAPFAGAAADRWGGRRFALGGLGLVAAAMAVAGAARPGPVGLAVLLAAAGAGFGLFTPANNAAIMCEARPGQAGQVGGVLTMTRSLGTALGVAVTGLAVAQGFRTTAWMLAAVAACAALTLGGTIAGALRR
ncbi:MFS transporter [Acidothermaceae bacterium B102]|nr:MFS transporter [Acidothermaceae bacterium B102]